jgi:hypothetical protein
VFRCGRLTVSGPDPEGTRRREDRLIGGIEADRGDAIGSERYAELCDSPQRLLDELEPSVREGYRPGA